MLSHRVSLPISGLVLDSLPPHLVDDPFGTGGQNLDFTTLGILLRPGLEELADAGESTVSLIGFTRFSGVTHVLLGTEGKVYSVDMGMGTLTDRTPSDVTFNASLTNPWEAVTFTNTCILTNGQDDIHFWNGSGDLNDAGISYRARVVRSYGAYTLLLSSREEEGETWHDVYQRIRWSVPGAFDDFTGPGSGFLDLVDTPDRIMTGRLFGASFVVYKKYSVIILDLTGGGAGGTFRVTSSYTKSGLVAQRALVDAGGFHILMGHDNFYRFEGSPHLEPVGDSIKEHFQRNVNWDAVETSHAINDIYNHKAIFYVPVGTSPIPNLAYIFDYRSGAWSIYEIPEVTASLHTEAYGHYVALGSGEVCRVTNDVGEDLTEGIPAMWQSKEFVLEESEYPLLWKRFLGVYVEAKGDVLGFAYSIDRGETWVVLEDKELNEEKWLPYKIHIDDSGKSLMIRFTNGENEGSLGIRAFTLLYEMGGPT